MLICEDIFHYFFVCHDYNPFQREPNMNVLANFPNDMLWLRKSFHYHI